MSLDYGLGTMTATTLIIAKDENTKCMFLFKTSVGYTEVLPCEILNIVRIFCTPYPHALIPQGQLKKIVWYFIQFFVRKKTTILRFLFVFEWNDWNVLILQGLLWKPMCKELL